MKVLYNWLKDFVDVKASAQELASRLSLAGCNIGAVEDSPSGPVLEADLTTNRPDCLGHYGMAREIADRKSTRLNSSHGYISYAVFCLKKKKTNTEKALRWVHEM